MFYTPGEKLETNVVTNSKAFQLMINFMYEKKDKWERISIVELFQVAFLATKYNMEGLMDKVVEECKVFPSTGLEILDAASIAKEFQDIFPRQPRPCWRSAPQSCSSASPLPSTSFSSPPSTPQTLPGVSQHSDSWQD